MRVTAREKMVVLAIRGVSVKERRKLFQIARDEGINTISGLLRREIKRLIRASRKAA